MGLGIQNLVCPRCGNEFFVLPEYDIPPYGWCGWDQFGCPHCGEVFIFGNSSDNLFSKFAKRAQVWHENRASQRTSAPRKVRLWQRFITWFSKDLG